MTPTCSARADDLEEQEGAYPVGGNRFSSSVRRLGASLRRQDGASIRSSRRYVIVRVNPQIHQWAPAVSANLTALAHLERQHRNAEWLPFSAVSGFNAAGICPQLDRHGKLAFSASRMITAPTNVSTIDRICVHCSGQSGFGNKAPHPFKLEEGQVSRAEPRSIGSRISTRSIL